jgi:hypothetical protein
MGFILPVAFALLVLAIPIVLLYLLRLRREERVVSSVYLWRQAVRDLEANAPWQRLRRNLLLFLQLAALGALVLAVAGLYLLTSRVQGNDLILIVDTSASMAATDLRPNRMEAARREAQRLAASLPSDGRVTLIAAGGTPRVLLSHSPDRALLKQALEKLQPSTALSDLTPAMRLAATLATESPQAEVVLLSDGQVFLEEEIVLPAPFRFISLGESDQNQGVIACSLDDSAGRLGLFVQIRNFSSAPAQRRLDLYVDGRLLTARHIDLPAKSDVALSLELDATFNTLEARLNGADGTAEDDLPLDDTAWAVPPRGSATNIVLVTEGNRFLQTGLGLLAGVELTLLAPDDFAEWWTGVQEEAPPPGMFLFDAYVPPEIPLGSLFFVAPPTSTLLFQVEGQLANPHPHPVREDDPILRYVDIGDIGVRRSQAVALPTWARAVLVDDEGWPLLFVGESEGRRVAVLAFDLHQSDLPLRVAFPILLSNLYEALAPGTGGSLPPVSTLGDPLVIESPPQVEEIVVRSPDGREKILHPTGGRTAFEETSQPGIYEVIWRGQGQEWAQAYTAVSLLSPDEGTIAPQSVLPEILSTEDQVGQADQAVRVPLQRWLAGLSLLILMVEWGLAHRGGLAGITRVFARLSRTRNTGGP